jgi:hypothetical protein
VSWGFYDAGMQYSIDSDLARFLHDWQTLLTGVLALIGAAWTVMGIRAQIHQTQEIAKDEREREEFAARAVLSLALSQLINYAQGCLHFIKDKQTDTISGDEDLPTLEEGVVPSLQDCARYTNKDIASKIWTLLSNLQVQQSRFRDLADSRTGRSLSENEVLTNSLDAANLYAKTAELFHYARDEEGMRKLAPDDRLRSALNNVGFIDADHPAIKYLNDKDKAKDEEDEASG